MVGALCRLIGFIGGRGGGKVDLDLVPLKRLGDYAMYWTARCDVLRVSSSRLNFAPVSEVVSECLRRGIAGTGRRRLKASIVWSWNRKTSWSPHRLGNWKGFEKWEQQQLTLRIQRGTALSMTEAFGSPPADYRPNVGLCLVNDKDEVFVASRLDLPGCWQMPQGGVDEGEEPEAAAIRELREETGITSAELLGEVPHWLTYDFPPDVNAKIASLWGRNWKGQAQKWFLFRFEGNESEINLHGDGSEAPEFGEWRWLPPEKVLKEAVEFKRPVYEQAFRSLSIFVDSWAKL